MQFRAAYTTVISNSICHLENLSENIENLAPAASADDAVGVPQTQGNGPLLHWFVAVVNNRSERKVATILSSMGHETFLPTRVEERKRTSGRAKKVECILLPATVFIHCTEEIRLELVNTPFIKRFKTDRTRVTRLGAHPLMTIPDDQVIAFRRALDLTDDIPFEEVPFSMGEKVRVDGGQFDGLTGNVVRLPNGRHQLIIALGTLGGFKLTIATRHLKKIK